MGNMGGGYGDGEDFDESEDFEGKIYLGLKIQLQWYLQLYVTCHQICLYCTPHNTGMFGILQVGWTILEVEWATWGVVWAIWVGVWATWAEAWATWAVIWEIQTTLLSDDIMKMKRILSREDVLNRRQSFWSAAWFFPKDISVIVTIYYCFQVIPKIMLIPLNISLISCSEVHYHLLLWVLCLKFTCFHVYID